MIRLFAAFATCSLLCLVTTGCGSGSATGKVTGTVTMDGKPLSNARVTFTPLGGGRTAMGKTDGEGKYELYILADPGAEVGNHKVSITTIQNAGIAETMEEASADDAGYEEQAMNSGDYSEATPQEEAIPAKYNTESELTAEVKSGKNVHDFALTSS